MLKAWIIPVFFAAVVAACGPPAAEDAPVAPPAAEQPQASGPPASPRRAADGALPAGSPAAHETMPRFVGMWAVDRRLCDNPAWRFEADQVSTQGEVHCDFNRILPVPTGYSVQATCTAEAPPAPYEIEFEFDSAQAMRITGGPWAHANLVYCGPLTDD